MSLFTSPERRRYVAIMATAAISVSLFGCAPPPRTGPATVVGQGGDHPITAVHPIKRPMFQTVELPDPDAKLDDKTGKQTGKATIEYMQARGPVGKFGGTFYSVEIGEGPKTFNPIVSTDATSSTLGGMLTSGLVSDDAYTGEVVPYLARSVKLGDDKLTYTVTLRKGLKWSDGKPLTAQDVVFTWNELIKNGLGNASLRDLCTLHGKFPDVKATDDLTIVFKTAEPFAPFMRNLGFNILPAHVFKPILDKEATHADKNKALNNTWTTSDAEKHPEVFVSNGMWILDKYNSSEKRVVFKRNPKFFMIDSKNQRLPYLDKYVVSYVGDQNNEHLQFEQGKSDVYAIPGDKLVLTKKMTRPNFTIYNLGATTGTTFVTFNENTRKNSKTGKPIVDPIKSSWFTKTEFRQAVDYAINRQDIVDNIIKGVGAPLFTAECLPSIFLNKKLAAGHPQDIVHAKELLKKAGFTWDGQGRLFDDKGNPVEFTLYTNAGNNIREAIGVNIKEDLTKLGMKVNFKPIEFNVLIGKMSPEDGDWDAVVMGLTGGTLEPNSGANVWKSDGSLHMFNQRALPDKGTADISDRTPWEKDIDQAFADGVKVFDFNQRRQFYDKYQQVAYDQQPFIYLYSGLQMIAVKNRIQNLDPTPLGAFHNLEEIWIDDSKDK